MTCAFSWQNSVSLCTASFCTLRSNLPVTPGISSPDFPDGSDGKVSAYNAGDPGSTPGLGRSPEEMATHSSITAWKIPWKEEPRRLQSMWLQRVGHD